ncbi:Protein phosphatase 2C-like protein [Metarhizium album ARSEF 1941]|uniref:Protein phosphatase 2C-like protein n=1 Tax=Metarhizium album (strain ARSEF 1941) TaxID=1081103 RepID=A0A0B2WRG4_METAS|nr:Protein phosphatase 2C-like protein [Metarhizium album ARSEF 1941]KHN96087.1 Protein phosphatase 2C-like protein [Metarhizium album ARSEF 1941]
MSRTTSAALPHQPIPTSLTQLSRFKSAFRNLDARIMNEAKPAAQGSAKPASAAVVAAMAPAVSGSCALASMYDPATSLSRDQTGFNHGELRCLDESHPGEIEDVIDPKTGRLLGIAATRASGDHRRKAYQDAVESLQPNSHGLAERPKYATLSCMTAEPEVITRKVAKKESVILASYGP